MNKIRRDLPDLLGLIGMSFFLRATLGTTIYIMLLIPAAALIHLWRAKGPWTRQRVLEHFLLYFLVLGYGFGGIWGFVGHFFMADSIAQDIGWATGSPFQMELAFYHLGLGFVGILAWWYRGELWTALIVSKSIFLYGAAYTHIRDIVLFGNYAPSNAGFEILYLSDLILPTLIIGLYVVHRRANVAERASADSPSFDKYRWQN